MIKCGSQCLKKIQDMDIITLPSGQLLKLKRYEVQHEQGVSVEYLENFRKRLFRNRQQKNSPGEPFLICKYDELYVKNGIVFNPNNLRIMGLTSSFETEEIMTPFYSVLSDMAAGKDVDRKILERYSAKMVLQTIISDLGSDFDEIGPCWSSVEPMKKHMMYTYLVDGLMLPLSVMGLEFQAMISDMSSGNLSFVQLLASKSGMQMINQPIKLYIPFYDHQPLFLFDSQHALKSLRNAMFGSTFQKFNIINQCYPLQCKKNPITVDHLRTLYKNDDGLWLMNRKLTQATLYLDPWSKQDVGLALNIFDPTVLSALKDEADYKGTYDFILNSSKLLVGTIVAPGKNDKTYSNLTDSKHEIITQMKKAFVYFKNWSETDPDSSLHIKTYLAISSIRYGVEALCDRFNNWYRTTSGDLMQNVYMCLPRLSTNDVEKFFSNVRRTDCDSATKISKVQAEHRLNQNLKMDLCEEKENKGQKRNITAVSNNYLNRRAKRRKLNG